MNSRIKFFNTLIKFFISPKIIKVIETILFIRTNSNKYSFPLQKRNKISFINLQNLADARSDYKALRNRLKSI